MNTDRTSTLIGGALLIAGSLIFVAGGAQHPHVNSSMGTLNSPEFWSNFALHIAHHPAWERIHAMILAGPLLWVLGLALLHGRFDAGSDALTRLASTALTLFAALWSVTFIFDGFLAPMIVRDFAPEVADLHLRVVQEATIRFGLLSWLLLACALIAISMQIIVRGERWRWTIGSLGLILGVWPFIAWTTGSFEPGPFTSPLWNPTAVATALWFVLVGISAFLKERAERGQMVAAA